MCRFAARQHLSAQPAAPLPRLVQGGFRPDSAQWANITLGTVTARRFPGLVSVEAQVATDDDTTTQVYSPFTGQIVNIDVLAGDHVAKGTVLMTVAASEVMQSENDLIAAAGTIRPHRSPPAMPTPMRFANMHFIKPAAPR